MTADRALEVMEAFAEATTILKSRFSSSVEYQKKYEETKKRLLELEKQFKVERQERNRFKRNYEILASVSHVQICGQCDGEGGFQYEGGPGEVGSEMCPYCEGSGIIEKQTTK